MDLDKLKAFYWVALLGNITHAAHRLNTTQSALSRLILNLEESLGVKLFKRVSRGVEILEDGKYLFEFAKKVVTEAEAVVRILRNKSSEPKGELKLLTTTSIASTWLMQYIPGFLGQYPDMRLNIITDDEALALKDADLAIRPYMYDHPDVIQVLLTTFYIGLFASKEYLDKFGMPKEPADLDNHQLLIYGGEKINSFWNINWLLTLGRGPKNPREPYMQLNSSQGLLNAAKQGLGIVAFGREYPKLEHANLIEVLPELEGPKVEIYAIFPQQCAEIPRIKALVNYLAKQASKQG